MAVNVSCTQAAGVRRGEPCGNVIKRMMLHTWQLVVLLCWSKCVAPAVYQEANECGSFGTYPLSTTHPTQHTNSSHATLHNLPPGPHRRRLVKTTKATRRPGSIVCVTIRGASPQNTPSLRYPTSRGHASSYPLHRAYAHLNSRMHECGHECKRRPMAKHEPQLSRLVIESRLELVLDRRGTECITTPVTRATTAVAWLRSDGRLSLCEDASNNYRQLSN